MLQAAVWDSLCLLERDELQFRLALAEYQQKRLANYRAGLFADTVVVGEIAVRGCCRSKAAC